MNRNSLIETVLTARDSKALTRYSPLSLNPRHGFSINPITNVSLGRPQSGKAKMRMYTGKR
jgi:hypothetical protein